MMRTHRLLAAAVLLATTAPVLAQDAAPETQLCLENRDIRAKDLSPKNGYYARTSKGWWHNNGPSCSAYDRNLSLITRSTENRQCRGDTVRVFDPFSKIEFGSCVLGEWERVSAPPKD